MKGIVFVSPIVSISVATALFLSGATWWSILLAFLLSGSTALVTLSGLNLALSGFLERRKNVAQSLETKEQKENV